MLIEERQFGEEILRAMKNYEIGKYGESERGKGGILIWLYSPNWTRVWLKLPICQCNGKAMKPGEDNTYTYPLSQSWKSGQSDLSIIICFQEKIISYFFKLFIIRKK